MNKNNTLQPTPFSPKSNKKNKRRGQALSEYLILTAIVGIGSIGVVQLLSTNLNRKIGVVSEAIRGEKKTMNGVELNEKHYKVYDLGDFNQGMTDSGDK